ncbi:MAG: FAD-binding domain-containing protein [Hyphomicrobium sp.]
MIDPTHKIFDPSRAEGLRRIGSFLERAGKYYTENRNYDLGPQNRPNVSELSAYLRLRLITEKELTRKVLSQHSLSEAGKFIEEVCWRTYWKGWVEHRPKVWSTYLQELEDLKNNVESNADLYDRYRKAITGQTHIEAFDFWVHELISTGYLHNHARMWFASIWIFTLGLPWVLGAQFFFHHLLDGDPASNTLSWRWVAGLQTKGKSYIAKSENIFRFTKGRFHPKNQLLEHPHLLPFLEEPIEENLGFKKVHSCFQNLENIVLLVTEENLTPEHWCLSKSCVKGIAALPPNSNDPPISESVLCFREAAIQETLLRAQNFFCSPTTSLHEPIERDLLAFCQSLHVHEIVTAYVPIGPTRQRIDRLKTTLVSSGIAFREVHTDWDAAFWPHARAGYFKLKERIPDVLDQLFRDEKEGRG